MSELMSTSDRRKNFRRQLLATASALALLGSVYAAPEAKAADGDGDHPTVWIELGEQLESLDASEQQFAPSFLFDTPRPAPEPISPLSVGHQPRFSVGGEGKVTFAPDDTNWIFSAAIRYGRSNAAQHLRQQSPYPTKPLPLPSPSAEPYFRQALEFIDTKHSVTENHLIADFQAGKDVGLGMFGSGGSSVFSLGVRFAQFGSKANTTFASDPDAHPTFKYFSGVAFPAGGIFHSRAAAEESVRSFRGIGPSISWNASAPVVGNPANGQATLDWGLNAAILFGRQKARVHYQTTVHYHAGKYNAYNPPTTPTRNTPPDKIRARTVMVPNIGGFAGFTFRLQNFKVSAGYRADLFFGAMDGGIDTAKKENVGFYGPFATVSVGLGG
jgi:iron complex outermembrane recepter protein